MSQTTRATWEALAQRCREATGPDPEIDAAIADAGPAEAVETGFWNYTASLDSIVSLIEKTLPRKAWEVASPYSWSGKNALSAADVGLNREYAKTPALALCAAYCMARAGMEDDAP